MSEISRIEYEICSEDGVAFEWMDDKQAAISFGDAQDEPCFVREVIEYYPDKSVVWASHSSLFEVEE